MKERLRCPHCSNEFDSEVVPRAVAGSRWVTLCPKCTSWWNRDEYKRVGTVHACANCQHYGPGYRCVPVAKATGFTTKAAIVSPIFGCSLWKEKEKELFDLRHNRNCGMELTFNDTGSNVFLSQGAAVSLCAWLNSLWDEERIKQ